MTKYAQLANYRTLCVLHFKPQFDDASSMLLKYPYLRHGVKHGILSLTIAMSIIRAVEEINLHMRL